jgi:hypothetical protein
LPLDQRASVVFEQPPSGVYHPVDAFDIDRATVLLLAGSMRVLLRYL